MLNKRVATLLIGTILMGSLAVGCGSSDSSNSNKITISGSTSVGPVVEILGEDFEAKNEGVSIEVQQIGSSAGIKNAIDGTSQIGMASRDLKDENKPLYISSRNTFQPMEPERICCIRQFRLPGNYRAIAFQCDGMFPLQAKISSNFTLYYKYDTGRTERGHDGAGGEALPGKTDVRVAARAAGGCF